MSADVQAAAIEKIAEWLRTHEIGTHYHEIGYEQAASELWELLGLEQVGTIGPHTMSVHPSHVVGADSDLPVFRLALPQEAE